MPYKYQVPGFSVTGDEIANAFEDKNVASIVVHLSPKPGQEFSLQLKVYAVDEREQKVFDVTTGPGKDRLVSLKNRYIERFMFITRDMIAQVSEKKILGKKVPLRINGMEFKAQKDPYTYNGHEYPQDHKKDFVAYKVKIDRDRIS